MKQYAIFFGADKGFWSKSGNYTSDAKQAKRLSAHDAIQFCRSRYSATVAASVIAVPVDEDMLEAILEGRD